MIKMGMTVKDKITGFQGLVTGLCQYISGCNQVLIVPKLDKQGQPAESHWFDEQRCVRVGRTMMTLENDKTPGPDKAAPKR